MIRFVSFDLDGTLLDTSEGIIQSVQYTVDKMGLHLPSGFDMGFFIGPPIQMSLQKCFGISAEESQKGANIFRSYYKSEALFLAKPYEGIFQLFDVLCSKKIKIGVATYKREDYALDILHHFLIAEYCDAMCGADNNNILTKSDIIRNSCEKVGVSPDETIYIGDTEHDAKGAYEANTSFVAVTWGFGYKEKAFSSEYPHIGVVNRPIDIVNLV